MRGEGREQGGDGATEDKETLSVSSDPSSRLGPQLREALSLRTFYPSDLADCCLLGSELVLLGEAVERFVRPVAGGGEAWAYLEMPGDSRKARMRL